MATFKRQILESLPPERRAPPKTARTEANSSAFDVIELLGIAAGFVGVAALTGAVVEDMEFGNEYLRMVLNLAIAIPSLVVAVAPFVVRRLRRGLPTTLVDTPKPSWGRVERRLVSSVERHEHHNPQSHHDLLA